MASWASVAKASPQPVVAAQDLNSSTENLRLLVVDANAIIGGLKLEGIADRAVTVQEVFDEIRDKQSRQFLTTLPYQLQLAEPTEESVRAVTRFARETGDIAALSSVDIKLLALARTLEVAAHGIEHLAAHASQPRMHNKAISSAVPMPGWGAVPNPEDWKVVDEANEADEAAAAAASTSRIAQGVQQLSLDPSQPNSFLAEEASPAAAAGGGGVPVSRASAAAGSPHGVQQQQQQQQEAAAVPAAAVPPPQQQQQAAAAPSAADEDDEDDEDDAWNTAASSKNAARRKKRKEFKRQERQRAFEQEWEEHTALMQQQQPDQQQQQQQEPAVEPAVQQQQNGAAAAAAEEDSSGSEGESEDGEADGGEEVTITIDDLLAAEHQVYTAEDEEADEDAAAAAAATAAAGGQQQEGLAPGMPGWHSSVACVTADFAMQNVLLQMGLRLLTRDGRRIARLSRYALRCSACYNVTREPGRLFCPKCGNMTLDRVEVVVGADGAEYFGVRKRHILRGTKFSLPKPRGGRNSNDPVLREDVFLLKVKALGRRAAKKKKPAADGDADSAAADGSVDPFAPEFSADTWHVQSQTELAQHRGLAAVLQPAWKNNPNERKLTRSNRRG